METKNLSECSKDQSLKTTCISKMFLHSGVIYSESYSNCRQITAAVAPLETKIIPNVSLTLVLKFK